MAVLGRNKGVIEEVSRLRVALVGHPETAEAVASCHREVDSVVGHFHGIILSEWQAGITCRWDRRQNQIEIACRQKAWRWFRSEGAPAASSQIALKDRLLAGCLFCGCAHGCAIVIRR